MKNFSKNEIEKLKIYLQVKNKPSEHEEYLWGKVAKYNKYFSKIPGIQCICICNSLAMNAAHKDSDIDLFIITQKNRLWTARIYMTFFLSLIHMRKTHTSHAGKFCISFLVSQEESHFLDIQIKNDIYLFYWIQTLRVILNRGHAYETFLYRNKINRKKRKENISDMMLKIIPRYKSLVLLGDIQEYIFKSIFLPRTKKSFQKLGKPFGVVISDTMLKFHDKDRRKEIRNAIFS